MSSTPLKFAGTWYHSVCDIKLIDKILQDGWNPELASNTIYGTAVYLARTNWWKENAAEKIIACELVVSETETMDEFGPLNGCGSATGYNTTKHLLAFFSRNGIPAFKTPQSGKSEANIKRRDFFLARGIRAICFEEYARVDVIAVYDTKIIINKRAVPRDKVPFCPI